MPIDVPQSSLSHTADPITPLDTVNMADAQWTDSSLQPALRYLSRDIENITASTAHQAKLFQLCDNILYRRNYEPHGRP